MDSGTSEKMKKAIGLLKLIAQGECDIGKGNFLSQEDFFSSFDREFDKKNLRRGSYFTPH